MQPQVERFEVRDLDFDDLTIRDDLAADLESRLVSSIASYDDCLKNFVPNSDEFQISVVNETSDTIRMIAPAGAGKTQTLINRLLHNIANRRRP